MIKRIKITILIICLVLTTLIPVYALNEKTESLNNISNEKIKEIYNSNGEEYFEKIPNDLLQKYSKLTQHLEVIQ